MKLTKNEQRLVDHSKKAITKYNSQRKAMGEFDTIYAFVLSDSGKIYDGACLESNSGSVCAERAAIANMVLNEAYSSKIASIVVFDPVPKVQKESTTPCGTCRVVILECGSPDTTVICGQYIQLKDSWKFVPKMEKYTIKELYPKPYTKVKWD